MEIAWANHWWRVNELIAIMENKFMAVVELVDGKFTAFCAEIPDAKVERPTKMEALSALRVAVIQILDQRRERAIDGASPNAVFEAIAIG
jgi:predicted DNA-binding ribbon-helix-helix protein